MSLKIPDEKLEIMKWLQNQPKVCQLPRQRVQRNVHGRGMSDTNTEVSEATTIPMQEGEKNLWC